MIRGVKTRFGESHHSDLYPVFVHVECKTLTSEFLEYRNLIENYKCLSPSSLAFSSLYIFVDFLKQDTVYTCDKFSCHLTEAFHVLYNVQLYDKRDFLWNIVGISIIYFLIRNVDAWKFGTKLHDTFPVW